MSLGALNAGVLIFGWSAVLLFTVGGMSVLTTWLLGVLIFLGLGILMELMD